MLADELDYVVGVDTHRDEHVLAVLAAWLSRGGDRQLNRALHTVVLHRRQHDPTTKAYLERRLAEGKSRRDATRLLKRYLARHLYRLLQQEPLMT